MYDESTCDYLGLLETCKIIRHNYNFKDFDFENIFKFLKLYFRINDIFTPTVRFRNISNW